MYVCMCLGITAKPFDHNEQPTEDGFKPNNKNKEPKKGIEQWLRQVHI